MDKSFFAEQFINYYTQGYNGWMMNLKSSHRYRFDWAISKMKLYKKKMKKSLELACASGDFTQQILGNFAIKELICVDLCEEAINICKQKIKDNNVCFEICELPDINYPTDYFDAIWCMDVIYYLDIGNQYRLAYEISRMLAEDGVALFMIPYNQRNCSILKRCVRKYMDIIEEDFNYNALWGEYTTKIEKIYRQYKDCDNWMGKTIASGCVQAMQSEFLMNVVRKINIKYFRDKKSHMMIIAKKGARS